MGQGLPPVEVRGGPSGLLEVPDIHPCIPGYPEIFQLSGLRERLGTRASSNIRLPSNSIQVEGWIHPLVKNEERDC